MKLVHYTLPEEGSGLELIPRLVPVPSPQVTIGGLSNFIYSHVRTFSMLFFILDNVWGQFHDYDVLNHYSLFLLIAFMAVFIPQLVLLFR